MHGHEFLPENIRIMTNGQGLKYRMCRICIRVIAKRSRAKMRLVKGKKGKR